MNFNSLISSSNNTTANAAAVAAVVASASASNGTNGHTPQSTTAATPSLTSQQSSAQINNQNNNSNNMFTPNATTPQNSNMSHTSSKLNLQQQITNGLFIRKEIQRFESVHPNIYTVYDLIDNIADFNLQQQLREHIVNIEGQFFLFSL